MGKDSFCKIVEYKDNNNKIEYRLEKYKDNVLYKHRALNEEELQVVTSLRFFADRISNEVHTIKKNYEFLKSLGKKIKNSEKDFSDNIFNSFNDFLIKITCKEKSSKTIIPTDSDVFFNHKTLSFYQTNLSHKSNPVVLKLDLYIENLAKGIGLNFQDFVKSTESPEYNEVSLANIFKIMTKVVPTVQLYKHIDHKPKDSAIDSFISGVSKNYTKYQISYPCLNILRFCHGKKFLLNRENELALKKLPEKEVKNDKATVLIEDDTNRKDRILDSEMSQVDRLAKRGHKKIEHDESFQQALLNEKDYVSRKYC